MKKTLLTLILLISASIMFAQSRENATERPLNGINLNLLGDASIISLNYERLFLISSHFIVTGKLGLGYTEEFKINLFGSSTPPEKYMTIPHHITGNLGKRKHFFEFGLGGTIINGSTSQNYYFYPIIGYRIQPLKSKKVNFRVFGYMPINIGSYDIFFIPLGLNVGVCF